MMMRNRTIAILWPFVLLAALLLAACGGDDSGGVVAQPVVRLQVGDQVFEETAYSSCWPVTAENLVCNMNAAALAQPSRVANVGPGDPVKFVIEGEAGVPQKFTATLLDGPGGVQDFGAVTEAPFNTELPDGLYRVQVDAEYADIEGNPAYVSYVFGLQVAGVVVILPTPTPTPTLPPTPTFTPEPTATFTPTLVPSPTVTRTPTVEPSAVPTEEPTEEPVELPTEISTEAATEKLTPTLSATGDLGARALSGTVRVSEGGRLVALAGVPVNYIHSSIAHPERASSGMTTTDANGQFVFGELALHDTDRVILSVALPGYQPQDIVRSGYETWTEPVFDFVLVPLTAVSTPTPATATPTQPSSVPTQAEAASADIPPLTLTFAGRSFSPVGYQYCERAGTGERLCRELPASEGSNRRITLLRGAAAQMLVAGVRPTSVQIEYLSDTGALTGQPEIRPGDNIILFTVTPEPGSYILSIRVTWPNEEAAYFFRVVVSD